MKISKLIPVATCATVLSFPFAVHATETRVVYGTVLHVEPVVETQLREPTDAACADPKPVQANLAGLLAWDLAADCRVRREDRTRHYRVEYTWDGRKHTHITYERPPRRIPLLLTID